MYAISYPKTDADLKSVISLGDKNSNTVGHLPQVVYKDYQNNNGIITVKDKNKIIAFIMFRRTIRSNSVKIAQLCIDVKYRGQSIADTLLDELKSRYINNFRSIRLTCRKDFSFATKVWERNGFYPVSEKPGRGKKETILIIWAYFFDKLDLFSYPREHRVKAVLDINIIIRTRDLEAKPNFPKNPIKYLYSDDLTSEVEYYYANESFIEIQRDTDDIRRKQTRSLLAHYSKLKMNQDGFSEVYDDLCSISFPKNENDDSDRKQLSEAIVNNIEYFITTDEDLILDFQGKLEQYSIILITPTEFIVRFDQIQNQSTYLPRNTGIAKTSFKKMDGKHLNECIDTFFGQRGESKASFKLEFQDLISLPNTTVKIIESDSKFLALTLYELSDDGLDTHFIRITNYRNKYIIFNQIISELTKEAYGSGKTNLNISISDLDEEMKLLLKETYFIEIGDTYTRKVERGISNLSNLELGKTPFNLKTSQINELSNHQKYQIERSIFPGKIDDLNIKNLILPIKPHWASQLFDNYLASYSMFGAQENLIWNRNNVYFRSSKPSINNIPHRILWYASTNTKYGHRNKGIVACSYLENVVTGKPAKVFKQFEKLGTYSWSNIEKMVNHDLDKQIMALEFSDTEVFKNIIPLEKIQQLLSKQHTFPGPLEISSEQFLSIYNETLAQ